MVPFDILGLDNGTQLKGLPGASDWSRCFLRRPVQGLDECRIWEGISKGLRQARISKDCKTAVDACPGDPSQDFIVIPRNAKRASGVQGF